MIIFDVSNAFAQQKNITNAKGFLWRTNISIELYEEVHEKTYIILLHTGGRKNFLFSSIHLSVLLITGSVVILQSVAILYINQKVSYNGFTLLHGPKFTNTYGEFNLYIELYRLNLAEIDRAFT